MHKITFPFELHMKRPEVAHLHEALKFLGFETVAAEAADQRYGVSTQAAVMHVQTRLRSHPPCFS